MSYPMKELNRTYKKNLAKLIERLGQQVKIYS